MKKLTKQDKKILGAMGAIAAVIFIARLARAKTAPKGDVIIGPVTVTPTTYTNADAEQTRLTALVNQAYQMLGLDLDTMEPRNSPNAANVLVIQSTIAQLRAGGRASEANFLEQTLARARAGQLELHPTGIIEDA